MGDNGKATLNVLGSFGSIMSHHNIFNVPWHIFYKSLEIYWRDGTPFFQKLFPHLVFLMMVVESANTSIQNLP
uniref:Uncharacterized protein n=1 Tax=Anguilla anguilla TaxID=7936 RepID=A0A0E9QLT1_ANGAN